MQEGHPKSPEQERGAQFAQQLHSVLYHPVTVETIDTFAEDALERLITLNEAVISSYTKDFPESDQYAGRELEDKAYEAYGLKNLNEILDEIIAVRDTITQIKSALPQHIKTTSTIITPPDAPERAIGGNGTGTYESPRLFNRVLTLAYILEHDFDITLADTEYLAGSTTDSMMRQEPYVRVSVPELNRVVYVCDEEGNASYIFDTEVLEQVGVSIEHLDSSTKNQRNAFIRTTPTAGRRIIQSPEWRSVIKDALETPFVEQETTDQPQKKRTTSEFQKRERGPKLDLGTFLTEVREAYEEAGSPNDLKTWYGTEYPKHRSWPSNPHRTYANQGWVSWPAMVGKEVVELLPLGTFLTEVREAYEEVGSPHGVQGWYKTEYPNHPGWPAAPDAAYKQKGWVSWPAMVGKEVVELLPLGTFLTEVREAYKDAGSPANIQQWYKNEYPKHRNWPSNPHRTYANQGWVSWPAMVGKQS